MRRRMKKKTEKLLESHRQHLGLYKKVAKTLGISPGYVSLVANGKRKNEKIMAELIKQLIKLR